MEGITLRAATIKDIPFIVETIIEAEKSGTDKLSYSTIFGLTEEETRKYLRDMLLEEVDDCELSITSYLLAEKDNQIVAAVSAWLEGANGISSNLLKRNLLNYYIPQVHILKANLVKEIVNDLNISEKSDTIQIGMVFVSSESRKLGLSGLLIEEQIKRLSQINRNIREAQVQVFANNVAAINAYTKLKFEVVLEKTSANIKATEYFPSNKKILMQKTI